MISSRWLNGLVLLGGVAILASILVPNFMRTRARGHLTSCKSNLKNIGTALDMYASDWEGHYPESLLALSPNYLQTIPPCTGAGKDSYSPSYEVRKDLGYHEFSCRLHSESKGLDECQLEVQAVEAQVNSQENAHRLSAEELKEAKAECSEGGRYEYHYTSETYSLSCSGDNHSFFAVPTNYPSYSSRGGLVER